MVTLAPPNRETRLATQYETLRRQEHELLTELIDLLPKIEGLDRERTAQARDALFHADTPFLLAFVGPFSAGKSSLINALVGTNDLLTVGPTPTTDRITLLRHGDSTERLRGGETDTVFHTSPFLEKVAFVDTPGLESVFRAHEAQTRQFLHRSDAVLLVMLSTQAMTASNLDYLNILRAYGKNVIIIINQSDLLQPDELETVRAYVEENAQASLGYKPQVWPMSARLGMAAWQPDGTRDDALWAQSGLNRLEQYVDQQLGDLERLRIKLQTPLQIAQTVHGNAVATVRGNLASLDQYRSIERNLTQQLSGFEREQKEAVRTSLAEIEGHFQRTADRGSAATRAYFKLAHVLSLAVRGVAELIGVRSFLRRNGTLDILFAEHKVAEPLRELETAQGKLAPRLEGKDIQDVEDLSRYTRKEIDALPPALRDKVIGTVQPPAQYDRAIMQGTRGELVDILAEAEQGAKARLEMSIHNTLLYLGGWEAILIAVAIFLFIGRPETADGQPLWLILIGVAFALWLLALLLLPLRGRFLANGYAGDIHRAEARYLDVLSKAADKQVAYGMELRRNAAAPLLRLIDAQTRLQDEQLAALQNIGTQLTTIETALTSLGR